MRYNTLLFDLDGTLVDSSVGMINSLQHALDHHKIGYPGFDFSQMIGPPLAEGLLKLNKNLFQDKELLRQVSNRYREHYGQYGVYQCNPYAGIEQLLRLLKEKDKTLAVATLKPTLYAKAMLAHQKLDHYFDFILGTEVEQISVSKAEIVGAVLHQFPEVNKSEAIMIGDGVFDVTGAHKNKIDVIGVTYGFGSTDELLAAKPTFIVNDVSELTRLLS